MQGVNRLWPVEHRDSRIESRPRQDDLSGHLRFPNGGLVC
jgi:hypothetical protein